MKQTTTALRKAVFELKEQLEAETDERQAFFCNHVAGRRFALGITQNMMADMIGLSRSQITNIESGNSFVSIKTLLKICAILDCTPNDLLDFKRKRGK